MTWSVIKKFMAKLWHWIALLGSIGILGLYHLVVHLMPHLEGEYKLTFADQVLIFYLGVLVSGAMHHQRKSLDELAREDLLPRIEELVRELPNRGINVRDSEQLNRYLTRRFGSVRKKIRIIDSRPAKGMLYTEEYLEARGKLLSKGKLQERIVLINDHDDLKAVVDLMNKHAAQPLLVKYFPRTSGKTLLSMIILDESQVHFGKGFLGDPNGSNQDIELRSNQAAKAFGDYFQFLWGSASELKTLEKINTEEIAKIEKDLEDMDRPKLAVNAYGHQSYKRLLDLTRAASKIEIISFPKLLLDSRERSQYYETLSASILKGARHKRIIWNKDQVRFIQKWLTESRDLQDAEGLEIRFWRHHVTEPLFCFDLLDRNNVIFAQNLLGDHFTQSRDHDFIEMIGKYFDHVWEIAHGEVIKGRSGPPNFGLLKKLEADLKE